MLGAECWLAGWLVIGLLVVVGEWWLVTITHQLTSSSSHLPTRHPLTTTHHPPPTTHHPPTTNHQLPTTNYQPLKASHHSEAAVVLHERMVKPAIDAVLASQADRRCPRPVQALLAVCVHAWPQPTTTACNHSLQPQSATTACNHSLQPQPATTACNHSLQPQFPVAIHDLNQHPKLCRAPHVTPPALRHPTTISVFHILKGATSSSPRKPNPVVHHTRTSQSPPAGSSQLLAACRPVS